MPNGKFPQNAGKTLGFTKEQMETGWLVPTMGNTYSGSSPTGLAAVLDVAVVGKPDEMRGQIVKAFVIPRPSFLPDEALKHELQSHCKRTAAPYKYPREVEFVTELPKTTSGKTRRFELRRRGAATA